MNERDLKQRTFGTVGFSLVAHAGLIAILVFSQQPSADETTPAETVSVVEAAEATELVEVASNDAIPAVAANEEDDATISEARVATPVPQKAAKQKKRTPAKRSAAVQSAAPAKAAEPEKLSAEIEASPNEQAELTIANTDTDDTLKPKPHPTKPTPTVIPSKNQAKRDDRADATPEPIVSSFEQQPTQTVKSERSGAVVAVPNKDGTASAATTSAADSPTPPAAKPALPDDAEIRDADSLTTLSTKPFNYPAGDRAANRSGTVFVVGRIKDDGSVTDVQVERSSGSKLMDQEAVKTFKQWKFSPDDEGYVRKAVQFVLKDEDESSKDEQ